MSKIYAAKWIKAAKKHLDMGKSLSLDFWNTICILDVSPSQIRTQSCIEILSEFHIIARGEELMSLFNRTAKGCSQINQNLNGSEEYSAKLVWFLIGIIFNRISAASAAVRSNDTSQEEVMARIKEDVGTQTRQCDHRH